MLSTPLRFLHIPLTELCLATVLKSGQSFRWQRFDAIQATRPDAAVASTSISSLSGNEQTLSDEVSRKQGPVEWAFGWGDRTVCLRQDVFRRTHTDQGIYYRALYPYHHRNALLVDLETNSTLALLRHYFNLDSTPLVALYADWSARDPHFKKKIEKESERLKGIRVLNQDPWENLIRSAVVYGLRLLSVDAESDCFHAQTTHHSFICSANNNISRITLMVNRVCEVLGERLPHPTLFDPSTVCENVASVPAAPPTCPSTAEPSMYAFPSPTSLAQSNTDALLRHLGFGYRAPYIAWSSQHLLDHSVSLQLTPDEYLASLKQINFEKKGGIEAAREELLRFKGVGRKVADCVLLFSLGWTQTVPIDTHVFQVGFAIRDYAFPYSKATALTPLLHDQVANKLVQLWGPYAGHAQQVLFFADLKPAKPGAGAAKGVRSVLELSKFEEDVVKEDRKPTWQEEVDELTRTPGIKRRRVQVTTTPTTMTMIKQVGVEIVGTKVKVEDAYPSPASSTYTSSSSSRRGAGLKKRGRSRRNLKEEQEMEVMSRKSPIKG
ncbi:BQ5605_C005g03692 [Microbotryum silenes-dioicae]|uniref:DNA-(apurinic or apyrimidinic site) lyase n=1 Tax=Microbotryum silenes-dioicae TaxID=796604 RepID=A0A2X0MBN1_9BASI|nr:BQ5605_C005g03692 [Microbotryum silenes-dioicae]